MIWDGEMFFTGNVFPAGEGKILLLGKVDVSQLIFLWGGDIIFLGEGWNFK